ncbi:acyl carrier protein [Pseudomonas sp. Irchel s3b2]|uniref:acyl carrier protein n=1 Tax=Pseudomonas sp. Irchel s3b2 TaxID=2009073 RepID=UPI000BA313CF|nr:phosphopantetheine-binding protein [Pseudomonas sp. Irchel s3b2]
MSGVSSAQCEVECQVIKVLSDYFSVDRRKVEVDSRLVEDLYVDSMSLVEVVMALNEVFGVELPEGGVAEWKTVRDICCLVDKCR